MENAKLTPQLVMRRPVLRALPKVELPDGYPLRSFKPGDETGWEKIIAVTFETDAFVFDKAMKADPAFRPERVWFITAGGKPVATASAWRKDRFGPNTGYLHMVGVLPGHQGKHLGYWVSLAVMHQFVREGRVDAVLETDDYRIPAIKTYLKMGFEPLLVHENQRQRWRTIFQTISHPELEKEYDDILMGPVAMTEERKDDP